MIKLDKYDSAILLAEMQIQPLDHTRVLPFLIDEKGKIEKNPEYKPYTKEEIAEHKKEKMNIMKAFLEKNYRKDCFLEKFLNDDRYFENGEFLG